MATKLTGTNIQGQETEVVVNGDLIYDEAWALTVDPASLQVGQTARTHYGLPGIVLTAPPESV